MFQPKNFIYKIKIARSPFYFYFHMKLLALSSTNIHIHSLGSHKSITDFTMQQQRFSQEEMDRFFIFYALFINQWIKDHPPSVVVKSSPNIRQQESIHIEKRRSIHPSCSSILHSRKKLGIIQPQQIANTIVNQKQMNSRATSESETQYKLGNIQPRQIANLTNTKFRKFLLSFHS